MIDSTREFETQTTSALLKCAQQQALNTLDTARDVETSVRRGGLRAYYINGHMENAGNWLTAQLIAGQLPKGQALPKGN